MSEITGIGWRSDVTGGGRCELCGYDTGKPDMYAVVATMDLPPVIVRNIYGDAVPDDLVLLCCTCEREARLLIPASRPLKAAALRTEHQRRQRRKRP